MNTGKNGIVYYCRTPEQSGRNGHKIAVKLLKQGFREFFQADFCEEAMRKREFGKPYYGINPNLNFNISHCKDGVAVVLSDREVGVDVESMRRVSGGAVRKCCSREEALYVFGKKEDDKQDFKTLLQKEEAERFLRLWTLKESYVKMTGEGLQKPFDRVCFATEGLQNVMGTKEEEIRGFDGACRHYLRISENLILALTVQWKETKEEPDFMWRKC